MQKLFSFLVIILILVLTACSGDKSNSKTLEPTDPSEDTEEVENEETSNLNESDTEEDSTKDPSTKDEDIVVDPLPSTYKELEDLPPGEYNGHIYELGESTEVQEKRVAEKFNELLPDISENPSNKELDYYYRELIKLIQRDYQGPEELVKRLKFHSIGSPDIDDSRYQFKENLNVVVLLDASGSMAQQVDGKLKMVAAKDAITKFMENLPEETNVALRVYGHKGTGSDADKELSCSSSELIYELNTYKEDKFQQALNAIEPAGWTPTGLALTEAKKDLESYTGDKNTNIIYLVSDGIETCDTNPVQAAKELYESNITPIINVLGFDVDHEGQVQLKEIAETVDGIYQKVSDESELAKELEQVGNIAEAWEDWKHKEKESIEGKKLDNSLDIFSYITDQSYKATFEKTSADLITSALWEQEYISIESLKYLQEKNKEYHDWIRSEIEKFEKELEALNESSYKEALEALEKKYQLNTE